MRKIIVGMLAAAIAIASVQGAVAGTGPFPNEDISTGGAVVLVPQ
jgi:hypothetical protein